MVLCAWLVLYALPKYLVKSLILVCPYFPTGYSSLPPRALVRCWCVREALRVVVGLSFLLFVAAQNDGAC